MLMSKWPSTGFCEHGNEPSGSLQVENVSDWMNYYKDSQGGLCLT